MSAAAFVDRDGVVNDLVPDAHSGTPESPYRPADVQLMPGAAAGVAALRAAGYRLVLASNQPAAAKGRVPLEALEAVHRRVVELLAEQGASFDDVRYCLHHPDGVVAVLTGVCDCRKPAPGLLLAAAHAHGLDLRRSWTIGDADRDVQAGAAAGTRTALVEHPGSRHRRHGAPADLVAGSLEAAAAAIGVQGSR